MTTRLARPFAGLLLAAAILAGTTASPAAASAPPPSDTNASEERILALMNEERRVRGLAPVRRNAGADHIAQYSANIQAWYGRLGHNPNLGRDVSERVGPWWFVAENVGCAGDADRLHALWMQSWDHRKHIAWGTVETVGIGSVYARGCLWATVVFVDQR